MSFLNQFVSKVTPTMAVSVGIILLISNESKFALREIGLDATGIAVLLLITGGVVLILSYLQSAKKDNVSNDKTSWENIQYYSFNENKNDKSSDFSFEAEKRKIIKESQYLNELRKKSLSSELEESDKEKIIQDTIKENSAESIKTIFSQQVSAFTKQITEFIGLESIRNSFNTIIGRLQKEINDLGRRANVNLILGIAISAFGIYVLGDGIDIFKANTILPIDTEVQPLIQKNITSTLIELLPRFSFVFVIELFAYFFLKLYKNGLDEIKYFQNELTNVESKLISIEVAYITKNDASMKEALDVLVKTERNFVLKKGETTVELEKAKSESESMKAIINAVPSLFKQKGR